MFGSSETILKLFNLVLNFQRWASRFEHDFCHTEECVGIGFFSKKKLLGLGKQSKFSGVIRNSNWTTVPQGNRLEGISSPAMRSFGRIR
jgi:hypothetical protein